MRIAFATADYPCVVMTITNEDDAATAIARAGFVATAGPIDLIGVTLPDRSTRERWVIENGAVVVGPEIPGPVPETISDRQFFQALADAALITTDEAIAAVATGTLPASFEAFINALPSDQQFAARMLLKGATSFNRSHPLTAAFGQMQGLTSDQIDDLWRMAAAL